MSSEPHVVRDHAEHHPARSYKDEFRGFLHKYEIEYDEEYAGIRQGVAWAGEKLVGEAIFPSFGRTTSIPVFLLASRGGRKMHGRKILRATHFYASHLSASLSLSVRPGTEAEQYLVSTVPHSHRAISVPFLLRIRNLHVNYTESPDFSVKPRQIIGIMCPKLSSQMHVRSATKENALPPNAISLPVKRKESWFTKKSDRYVHHRLLKYGVRGQ